MKYRIVGLIAVLGLICMPHAWATNGDNLIGVGPVSRAMGGTGVAAPQDSISAIFANPAGMSFCPCGVESESVFGATLFDPAVDATIRSPAGTTSATSQHQVFVIPAVGVNMPLNETTRFGIGAFGISGLGVDYRNQGLDLDGIPGNGEGDVYSRLEIMKFAGMLSWQPSEEWALGLSIPVTYNNLDLGQGGTHTYAVGLQLGAVANLGIWKLGATYTTPQNADFDPVFNFDAFMGSTSFDGLELESPQSAVFGVAVEPSKTVLIAAEVKWYNWGGAKGYKDFDWEDQWVFALGGQYQASEKLLLRAGYNYGQNPIKEHNGFDPMGVTSVQGTPTPTLGYEVFRVIGFPGVVEHHVTIGAGYQLTESLAMNLEYMHGFENTISETSAGGAFGLESSLSENSLGFSLAWAFE